MTRKHAPLSLGHTLLNHALMAVMMMLLTLSIASPAFATDRPNIILCMGDDHGWDETGYNGHPYVKTPTLDAMASSGLRLDRFFAAHPTCSPTRGSVMTGRHPNRYGTFEPNYSIRPDEITIAHLLKDAGYACAHFGKWHLGPVKADSPTNPGAMGFDTWLSHDNFFELNPVLSHNGGPPQTYEGESSEILVEHAIKFLDQANQRNQPAFVVIWYGSPHEPYSGLESDLKLYDDVVNEFAGQTVQLTSNETGLQVKRPLGEVLRERYAEITAMDRSLGTLRQWLQSEGMRDNTLLWYCGDNGSPAGASVTTPLRGQKATMFDGGLRVPGIIEWPAVIRQPLDTAFPSVTSDILPTLCDYLDLGLPSVPLDGVSLRAAIDNPSAVREEPIFFWSFDTSTVRDLPQLIPVELQTGTTPLAKQMGGKFTRNFVNVKLTEVGAQHFGGTRVVLDGHLKLIVQGIENKAKVQLFDTIKDPAEQHDIAKGQPAEVERLSAILRTWQTEVLSDLQQAP